MSSEILTLCRLHVFHVWYVSIIQYFGEECKLYVDWSNFWIEPTATHFMHELWFLSWIHSTLLLILVTLSPTDFLNANLKRNFCSICCPAEFQVICLWITPIHSIAPHWMPPPPVQVLARCHTSIFLLICTPDLMGRVFVIGQLVRRSIHAPSVDRPTFYKKRMNFVSAGTFLSPKLKLQIGKHLKLSSEHWQNLQKKSQNLKIIMYEIRESVGFTFASLVNDPVTNA